jgi:hypothetical protein
MGLEDASDDEGQDSAEEEDKEEKGHEKGEEGHEDGAGMYDEVVGVTSLLQDLHLHANLGVVTLFTLLYRLVMTTGLSSFLLVTAESLVLLCCVLIKILILIY